MKTPDGWEAVRRLLIEADLPVLCDFFDGDGVEEGHGGAELFAYDFDRVFGFGFAEG
jgi:hypothetical protein